MHDVASENSEIEALGNLFHQAHENLQILFFPSRNTSEKTELPQKIASLYVNLIISLFLCWSCSFLAGILYTIPTWCSNAWLSSRFKGVLLNQKPHTSTQPSFRLRTSNRRMEAVNHTTNFYSLLHDIICSLVAHKAPSSSLQERCHSWCCSPSPLFPRLLRKNLDLAMKGFQHVQQSRHKKQTANITIHHYY